MHGLTGLVEDRCPGIKILIADVAGDVELHRNRSHQHFLLEQPALSQNEQAHAIPRILSVQGNIS